MRHLGIPAHRTEGAALRFLAYCQEGFRRMGRHEYPDVTLDHIAFGYSMPAWDAGHRDLDRRRPGHRRRNPHSIARQEFATMAQAADECITKVAGLDTVDPHTVRRENTGLLTQMSADLEARLTEPAAG